jgi:hypothetical protein
MTDLVEWWEKESRHIQTEEMQLIYARAQQEIIETLGKIVLAAGGEVSVPDHIVVGDVVMWVDYLEGRTVYRALAR